VIDKLSLMLSERCIFFFCLSGISVDSFDSFFHKLKLKLARVNLNLFDKLVFFAFPLLQLNSGLLHLFSILLLLFIEFSSQAAQILTFLL